MDNVEQWNLEGRCNLCRRKNYCKKQCSANKKRYRMKISNFIASMFVNAIEELDTRLEREEVEANKNE